MPLFGSKRDLQFVHHINDEYIKKVIGQEVGYYKLALKDTGRPNIYNESDNKIYNNPILVPCLIDLSPQNSNTNIKLIDTDRPFYINFYRQHLKDIELVIEKGDVVMWEDNFYEIRNIERAEYFFNKNPEYSYNEDNDDFGGDLVIKVQTVYISPEKMNLNNNRIG